MEPELPEVRVIAPEKELDPPTFQSTPVQSEQEGFVQPEVSRLPENPEADISGPDAQADVAAVMDGFSKIIDDFRGSRDVNRNEPSEPLPLGQQSYDRPQQFFDEDDSDEEDYPFKLSGSFVSFGVVTGQYSDGTTVNPPYFMTQSPGPYRIDVGEGYVYLSLTVDTYYRIIPSSVNLNLGNNVPEDDHPNYYKAIGYKGPTTVMNFVRTALSFYVCGFRGVFI